MREYNPVDSVNYGWKPLVAELHKQLLEIDPDYKILQVKEKFGGLRYYFDSNAGHDDGILMERLVDIAERKSFTICEVCGSTDNVETKPRINGWGWISTMCDIHHVDSRPAWEQAKELENNGA